MIVRHILRWINMINFNLQQHKYHQTAITCLSIVLVQLFKIGSVEICLPKIGSVDVCLSKSNKCFLS